MSPWWMRVYVVVAVILVVAFGGWKLADRFYLQERSSLTKGISAQRTKRVTYVNALQADAKAQNQLQLYVDRTLGGDLQTVDHKLRSRLNRLAEHVQLQGVAVGTGSSTRKESPAKMVWGLNALERPLREELDFIELQGWITGSGTFEQVLRLVDSIEAEPWIKRIDQLKLDPKDNGGRFDVSVKLSTLFLPGRTPNPATVAAANAAGFDRYMGLVQNSPFRVPPPPPPPPAQPEPKPMTDPPPPSIPPAFPYGEWALTGLAQSPNGEAEVWLLNQKSQEARRLAVGQSLHEAVLLTIHADTAEFRVGESRFMIAVGTTLKDRLPASQ